MKKVVLLLIAASAARFAFAGDGTPQLRAQIGAYYFDGWAGRNAAASDTNQPWAKDAPTHLRKRMLDEFSGREPVWGWRDDTADIMTRQIDLAADHGLSFWAFCWYFHTNATEVAKDSKHTGMNLFVAASNNVRMKFCMLVANHDNYQLRTPENWRKAAEMWVPYLKHPRHLTVGGLPLVMLFNAQDSSEAGLEAAQDVARNSGLPGIAFAACTPKPPVAGFSLTTRYNVGVGWQAGYAQHRFADLVESAKSSWAGSPELPHIPCLMAGWDKRPWEAPATGDAEKDKKLCWYFPDRTPETFATQLRDVVAWMDTHPEQATKERLAITYAWNELGEGGYLVPTRDDPDGAYLKALKSVVMP